MDKVYASLREMYHTDIGTFSKGRRFVIDNPEEGKGGYIHPRTSS